MKRRAALSRRRALAALGLGAGAAFASGCGAVSAGSSSIASARVVIIGGGFGGASCARAIKALNGALRVTLVEANSTYTACPMSNMVLAGARAMAAQQFGYAGLRQVGIEVIHARATAVDVSSRSVRLNDDRTLEYDKLVLAPGIEMNWHALPGLDAESARIMPHAWQAGPQTLLLRQQLQDMRSGGLVVISVPDNPYRCPPGPYERAGLMAHYLFRHNPRAKILILDAKDRFSKQPLFQQAWRALYGDMIQWQGLSDGARVVAVQPSSMRVQTDFDAITADVANIIPPQRAGSIARIAGVTDASGWCPIEPLTFASTLQRDVHVIGDAAIANAMPKSAFAANAQAKYCAVQIDRLLRGQAPLPGKLINTCYSLASPDYGFSVAGVYQPGANSWEPVSGAGGMSALDGAAALRQQEAAYARSWFDDFSTGVFG